MDKRQIDKRISLIPESSINYSSIPNRQKLFLLKKTEKVVLVTFLLTDFISDNDSLKDKIKDNLHQLVNFVCKFVGNTKSDSEIVGEIKVSLLRLNSLYNIAEVSGYFSSMNASVLRSEISNLIKLIDELGNSIDDNYLPEIKTNYFNVDIKGQRGYARTDEKRQIKDNLNTVSKVSIRDTKGQDVTDRVNKIIGVLKDKGQVSIKDISSVIIDCSEKTIQRTLNSLIDEGKIKKTGERRWARYEINN